MDIQKQPQENHTVDVTVHFDKKEFRAAFDKATRAFSRKMRVPGFRPGKAPLSRVVSIIGEETILQQTVQDLAEESTKVIWNDEELDVYGPLEFKNFNNDDDQLTLDFVVPLTPVADLGNYREEIRLPYDAPDPVTDEDVADGMEQIRLQHALFEEVERPVEMGDMAMMTHVRADLLPKEEGGETEIFFEQQNARIWIEEGKFLPGFAGFVVGLSAGDEAEFEFDLPEDYKIENAQGRTVTGSFTIEKVETVELPALTNDFAQRVNEKFDTLLDLRLAIRKELEQNATQQAEAAYFSKVLEAFMEKADINYPPMAVELTVEDMLKNLKQRLEQQNVSFDLYLRQRNITEDALREELRPSAEDNLRTSMVVQAFFEEEEMRVDEEALDQMINYTLSNVEVDQRAFFRQFLSTDVQRRQMANDMATERLQKRMIAIARGEEPPKGPPPMPKRADSEIIATPEGEARRMAEAQGQTEEDQGLMPGERIEGGIVRID